MTFVSIHFYQYIYGQYIKLFSNLKIINQANFYAVDL